MKKIAFIFPGQGSQSIGMGKDFYENSPTAKEMIESASDLTSIDFKSLLFEQNDKLEQTEFTQPAILLVSSIAHRLFEEALNLKPVFALGHSLGEFSALVSVGALDFASGVKLVHQRGKLMKEACEGKDAGMMAIIGLDDEKVELLCKQARDEGKRVWAANYNSKGQIVAAGSKNDLKEMESVFKDAGAKRALLLNMSVASHCPILESVVEPLKNALLEIMKDDFISPVISNVTADEYSSKDEAIELLPKQLIKPVLYKQSIEKFETKSDLFIEFGGNVLKGLNRRITKKPTISITDMVSLQSAFEQID